MTRGDGSQVGLRTIGGGRLPIAKGGPDLGLHRIHVEVAHGDEGGARGAIVSVVEVDEALARCGADDVEVADRQAFRQTLAGRQQAELGLQHAQLRRVAGAFLADDDAALGIDGVRRHQGRRHHLTQDVQAGIDRLVLGVGQLQHIGGLVKAGEGVGVSAEGQTQALKDAQHLVFRHVLGAVEGHVLHEVGQTLLVVALHQRAGVDAQAERGLTRRRRIVQQGVAHAVGQQAVTDGRVGGNVAGGLGPGGGRRDLTGGGRSGRRGLGESRGGERPGGQGQSRDGDKQ